MVTEWIAAVAVVLAVLSIVGIFLVLAKLRTLSESGMPRFGVHLDSAVSGLDEKLTQTRTDIAGRLMQVKGDLSIESADRRSSGFLNLKTVLEHQLAAGRQEVASARKLEIAALTDETRQSLASIRSDVDQKLAAISNTVQVKLDQNIKDGFAQFEKVQQHLNEAQEQLKNLDVIGEAINDPNNLLNIHPL